MIIIISTYVYYNTQAEFLFQYIVVFYNFISNTKNILIRTNEPSCMTSDRRLALVWAYSVCFVRWI